MTAQRKNLATFTIMIGVLTMVLAASALAEKKHERHRRGHQSYWYPCMDSYPILCRFWFRQSSEKKPRQYKQQNMFRAILLPGHGVSFADAMADAMAEFRKPRKRSERQHILSALILPGIAIHSE